MPGKDPIVISDSDSDTLSESERPAPQRTTQAKASTQPRAHVEDRNDAASSSAAGTSASGLLGMLPDRRQLELERKERAKKRRREQNLPSESSGDEAQIATKRSRGGDATAATSSRPALSAALQPQPTSDPSTSKAAQPSASSPATSFSSATDPIHPSSRFWTGTIKHSYNQYADPSRAGVTISQMLLPATTASRNALRFAVLATYDLRIEWLYSLFPCGLPVTLVLPPPKEDYRTDAAVARPGLHPIEIFGGEFTRCPGWQVCVPHKPKGGWLTQHMKFLILVHEGFLRVAILSGNLNQIDWERIENTAFIQDFPLLSSATKPNVAGPSQSTNDFKPQLIRSLRSLSLPASHAIYAALDTYDFSAATRARIVASWPEPSSLADWERIETQGLGRLGKVVRELGIRPSQSVEVECQGSSLANHDVKWVEHFHMLAAGVEPRGKLPLKGKANEAHAEYARLMGQDGLPPVKVCFPSHRYVEERTVEGPLGALSFFGKAETFAASSIKPLYHTPQSRRGDIMIHAKSILALTAAGTALVNQAFTAASDAYISNTSARPVPSHAWSGARPAEQPIGWTYLGSSNFTRAAHGTISGSASKPTMSCMNWELGVVLPVYASEVEACGVEAEGLRAVVYHRPVQRYAVGDAPWDNSSARALL
ncbi:uncharacterized protein SRS1_12290 [Sporisorium reilianum f. sp. reilianum]|uniref:Uncharacterized protein n=1 Tax=Sporisorium reilianum f. sp. reilianum TaxID=72559 RepID=A0A2N8U7P1_9BASI|nr:uncharacterized protein SRS1_12290 [Sporisorium reilianum f. sp. reilianum]